MAYLIRMVIGLIVFGSLASMAWAQNTKQEIEKRIAPVGKVYISEPVGQQPAAAVKPAASSTTDTTTTQPATASSTTTPAAAPTQVAGIGDPEKVYNTYCAVCHVSGAANAPKLTDKASWETRSKQGLTTLINHVWNGYNAMPARGTCSKCTKDDIKLTVEYMLTKAGLDPKSLPK